MTTMTAPSGAGGVFVRTRLSLMMFLQYAIWGVWLPVLAGYLGSKPDTGGLGFSDSQVGMILGLAGSIGAVAAPFIAGQVADRFLPAERALGILLLLGGVLNFALAGVKDYNTFLVLSILYSVVYMPTLGLSNSIAMANVRNETVDFPRVRVWGSIGWIVGSALFPLLWLQSDLHLKWAPWFLTGTPKADATALVADALRVSGVLSIAYAVYAFAVLPYTPPKASVKHPLAFLEAFALLKRWGVLLLCGAAIVIAMIHNIYFLRTETWLKAIGFQAAEAPAAMTVGQMVEIATLAGLGWFLAKLGFKWVLTIGALAYFLRFACFASAAADSQWLAYAGIALHGFCYAFFYAGAFLYIDRSTPRDARHSAQTAFGIALLGCGPVLAGLFNGWLGSVATVDPAKPATGMAAIWRDKLASMGVQFADGVTSWPALWWTEAVLGGLVFVVLLFFMPRREPSVEG